MAKRRAKGLGDTIENITKATGIDKIVKFIAGEDCGCNERKEKLNKLFPYRQPLCLEEAEYEFLVDFFKESRESISPLFQIRLLQIYNRIFKDNQQPTSCGSCWRDFIKQLKTVFDAYTESK